MNADVSSLLGLLSTTPPAPTPTPIQNPVQFNSGSSKEMPKEELLPLIAKQLLLYGLSDVASLLAQHESSTSPLVASNELALLCQKGRNDHVVEDNTDDEDMTDGFTTRTPGVVLQPSDRSRPAHNTPGYTSWFATQHKGAVRNAAFSVDGAYFATCSADNSLKVLDVGKIHACHRDPSVATADKPAIRTFYDHQGPANDVAFHPNGTILVSCSDDMTIKLYDLQRPNAKRGYRYFQDACAVRSVSFHPTGDFLLVGTDHECVRIYDTQTFKCFRPSSPAVGELAGSITKARFSPQGNVFATSSTDGTIRIYDGVGGKLINTIQQAHGGASVTSVEFSQNGKWLLSCGLDSLPRIWDLGSGRVLQTFEGATQRSPGINATFSQKDGLVLSIDDTANAIVAWDTKTGTLLSKYPSLHANSIRSVISSPVDCGFVTVSDDCRARYWFAEEELKD
ncbi:WD40-repeat-containing domain protein [Obelidium mucronatum]|nr:WD40-repeat-containing domain protein [Obelidium mucronatum]